MKNKGTIFNYNEDEEIYSKTLKLSDGNSAKIFFYEIFGKVKVKKQKAIFCPVWMVGLAIGKKKKNINDWFHSTGVNDIAGKTYSKYGIEVLLWAKEQIMNFTDCLYEGEILSIQGEDSKRFRVYSKALKKLNFIDASVSFDQEYYEDDGNKFLIYPSVVYIKELKESV